MTINQLSCSLDASFLDIEVSSRCTLNKDIATRVSLFTVQHFVQISVVMGLEDSHIDFICSISNCS